MLLKVLKKIIQYMSDNKFFIHPSAIVESQDIGSESRIWAFVHILPNVKIGRNANICDHCYIESNVILGDNVTVKCGVWLWDGVTVENNVFIGPSVTFANDLNPRSGKHDFKLLPTLLKEGCSIGAGAVILPGITIGKYAMIGAGSVVTKNVSDFELVYGNSAKPKGYICKCGKKFDFTENSNLYNCECGLQLKKESGLVSLVN